LAELNCPICSTLEEGITNEILSHLRRQDFTRDSTIIPSEQVSPGLFLLQSGRAKVMRLNPQGKELLLQILEPGDCFGEKSALDGTAQSDFVVAGTDVRLYLLPREKLLELLQKHPSLYPQVLKSICRWMDHLNGVIDSIGMASARERVAAFLKKLVVEQESELITLPHKKHEVALMLGLRPETFSRALGEIENAGAIRLNHRQIQVVDASLL